MKNNNLTFVVILTICLLAVFSNKPGWTRPAAAQAISKANNFTSLLFLYDFYATWCGNCKRIEPMLNMLEQKYKGSVKFVHVDIDAPENQQLVAKAHVEAVPTLYIIDKHGNKRAMFIGADEAEQIDGALTKELSKQATAHQQSIQLITNSRTRR